MSSQRTTYDLRIFFVTGGWSRGEPRTLAEGRRQLRQVVAQAHWVDKNNLRHIARISRVALYAVGKMGGTHTRRLCQEVTL
ncbi:MAG: hypothetical protein ACK52I_06915 [Pseudomonadota bacterium]